MDSKVRSSESFVEDSTGTIISLVPWSKANGGTLAEIKTRIFFKIFILKINN